MGMVALKCPGCGANIQLDDSREFGFCNYCGTKIMQDRIIVEHTGSVKLDNSEFIQKQLQNARRAKQKEDWEEVEKYYNIVEQNDPSNIEAIFYSSYAKACTTLVDADYYKKEYAFGVLAKSISIIDDNYDSSEKEIIKDISNDIVKLYNINFVYKYTNNGYGLTVKSDRTKTIKLFDNVGREFVSSLRNIIKTLPQNDYSNREYFIKIASDVALTCCKQDYLVTMKRLEGSNEEFRFIQVVNKTYNNYQMTIRGAVFNKPIPKMWRTPVELPFGEYEVDFYEASLLDSEEKIGKTPKGTVHLNVPYQNTIEINGGITKTTVNVY